MELNHLVKSLEDRRFSVEVFSDPDEVRQALRQQADPLQTIGFGGSSTLRQLDIPAYLSESGYRTIDHWEPNLSREQDMERRLAMGRCDLFLTSVNACTKDGRLMLVDGIGNRVAAAIFGPGRVIFILGTNKIVPDLDAAYERIRKVAAPRRAKGLGMNTPCAKTGECADCRSPQRICRATLILDYAPMATPSSVWIVRGEYGD